MTETAPCLPAVPTRARFGYHNRMMTARMLFFAHLQDVAGSRELTLLLPEGATVQAAAMALEQRFPGLDALLDHVRVAVNAEFAGPDTALHDGDEVAWMPPMSGGSGGVHG